jgi:hypothetical protein
MAGTPLPRMGTVSQKSFPARREIRSSNVRVCRIASTLTPMVIVLTTKRAEDFQESVQEYLWHEEKKYKISNDKEQESRSIRPVEQQGPVPA